MLGHKTSLNKFMKTHIKHLFLPQWYKTSINYKKKTGKFTYMWRLNNMLLTNHWVKEEIKRETNKKIAKDEFKWKYNIQNLNGGVSTKRRLGPQMDTYGVKS